MQNKSRCLLIFFFGFLFLAVSAAGTEENENNVSIGSFFKEQGQIWVENENNENFSGSLLFWKEGSIPIIDKPILTRNILAPANDEFYVDVPEGFGNGWWVSLRDKANQEIELKRFDIDF